MLQTLAEEISELGPTLSRHLFYELRVRMKRNEECGDYSSAS
jgi:hypothetical protein